MGPSEARSSLDALLGHVQVMRVKFKDDDPEPMLLDVIQEGSLKRLSMALDIDLAAHAAELRKAREEAWDEAIGEASEQGTIQVPDNPYREDQEPDDA